MKNIYLIIPALFVSILANAKGGSQAMTTGGIGGSGGFPHFNAQQSGNNNQQVSLRLIGKAVCKYGNGQFIPMDSTSYHFKTDRGGVITPDDLNNDETVLYDESYTYIYSNGYLPQMHRIQEYNGTKITSLEFEPWNDRKQMFEDSSKYLYDYADGKMIKSTLLQWYGGMWTNAVWSDIVYVNDKVTELNGIDYKAAFDYDANNRLTTVVDAELSWSGWKNKERHTYSYVNNEVSTHSLEKWNDLTGDWFKTSLWQYSYINGKVTEKRELSWDGSKWNEKERHSYSYDANQNKTADITSIWNGAAFENTKKITYAYNSQNLPEIITEQTWNGGSWSNLTGDIQYRYYYQNYFPSGVETISNTSSKLNLFPVPATNSLNIDAELKQAESLTVAIYDVRGIPVYHWIENAAAAYQKQIDVSKLPVGNYALRIKGEKSDISARFVIVR